MMNQLQDRLIMLMVLKRQGYRYIARAEHGELRAYKEKPMKYINFWHVFGELPHPIDQQNFEDVEWSDQKPLEIVKEIRKVQKALRCNA